MCTGVGRFFPNTLCYGPQIYIFKKSLRTLVLKTGDRHGSLMKQT
jgi:hypothetical protein